MILTLSLSLASSGATPPVNRVDVLRCGAADLRLTSMVSAGRTAPLAPISQKLTRRVAARQVSVALGSGHEVAVAGHHVPDRYVASWACVSGGRRAVRYVLLAYACTVDPADRNDCGGEKEWFRLLDTRGRFVDAGVPHDGTARDRLYARLGIADAMAAGVSMTAVVE